ncbi:hypothetical protein LAV84_30140 [Rhizobium sp. VS19-DR104.2]|uniref:hypothetical protein n=1 Tax=unclassified Rhizobium TaxID=2613769 RepID=UPI001C5BA1E0|nr:MULTISPECIES: hypothetical protein [unclassified Rhizobium]MBZ5763712.1 hypothetical protein [Rhizobium sp. VS19-DR96]MBZ5769643.1 hypothetical protein [Rhizobium sp. VS19-DR129.2]MBZ5777178.1 hypothetical protein [Rhizobium sp. VS19-DRK62.2]MBZ5788324.1 hypothetical protein [Rhizobium sp. VS19-DR121]MBZ5805777.1 hypothetical protein [Rhizobium sp. VS19-DR181]
MNLRPLLIASALLFIPVTASLAQSDVKPAENAGAVKGFDPLDSLSPASVPGEYKAVRHLPENLQQWEGLWRGQWEGTLDAVMTIVSTDGKKVTAYYGWGTNLLVTKPGGNLYRGTVENDTLIFPITKGLTITFKMDKDHRLVALHHSPAKETPSRAVFIKVES